MLKILSIFIGLACCLASKSCFAQKEFEKKYYFAAAEVIKGDEKTVYFSTRLTHYANQANFAETKRNFATFLKQNYQLENPKIKFTINKIGLKSPIRNLLAYRKAKLLTSEYYKKRAWRIVETDFGRED